MLSKHARQWYDPQLPPAQRLQANIDALASANLISASRTESLLADAEAAGVQTLKRCMQKGDKFSKFPQFSRTILELPKYPRISF